VLYICKTKINIYIQYIEKIYFLQSDNEYTNVLQIKIILRK